MKDLFNGLPQPKTSTQEVLLSLILQGNLSIFDFPYLSGFRTRISNLKLDYNLDIQTETKRKTNKFGNEYKYAYHTLPESKKKKAINLYNELNSKSK